MNSVGDYKFSRKWDDKLGVTSPIVFESPEQSWDARGNGFNFGIAHHNEVDATEPTVVGGRTVQFVDIYWTLVVAPQWDAGRIMCDSFV